jgi:RNA polymerase sigma-70 factor (ECF subfamily)
MNLPGHMTTTTELLDGLHDRGNHAAWEEFDRRYRPILMGFLRRMGLDGTDAADVAQETLACFVKDYRQRRYDREQGRLRSWLIGIARCRLADEQRRRGRWKELRGDSAIGNLPDEVESDAIWEAEQRQFIFEQAVRELRQTTRFNARTLEAFERIALKQEPVADVARDMGLSAQEIYNAKNRVVERLRDLVKRYEVNFLGD